LLPSVPASATREIRAVPPQLSVDRRDLAALEFERRVVFEQDRPGLLPRRAEPRRVVRNVQGRLDGCAALDVDLAGVAIGQPARPVHRQSVGRRDARVADIDAFATGAAVGQRPADRHAAAASAADIAPVESDLAAAGDRNVSTHRVTEGSWIERSPPVMEIDATLIAASPLRSSASPLLMTTSSPEPGSPAGVQSPPLLVYQSAVEPFQVFVVMTCLPS
jgi:hypothetical protein